MTPENSIQLVRQALHQGKLSQMESHLDWLENTQADRAASEATAPRPPLHCWPALWRVLNPASWLHTS